jgi:hypothetical protein
MSDTGQKWQCAICDYQTDSTEDFADHWEDNHERYR